MKLLSVTASCAAALIVLACGRSEPPASPAPTPAPKSSESAPASPPPKAEANPQKRIGDSSSLLFTSKPPVLGSYHLEMAGSGPVWSSKTNAASTESFTVKADVQGDNIHLVKTTTEGDAAPVTLDAYIMQGGLGNSDGGGKEFQVTDGVLKPGFGMEIAWVSLPLELLGATAIGGAGATAQGQESVNGRTADKFDINSDKVPAGVMAILGSNIDKLRGTVWVDQQTGALLKLNADYELSVSKMGSQEVAGKGPRHVELVVSNVGSTTVTLPQ